MGRLYMILCILLIGMEFASLYAVYSLNQWQNKEMDFFDSWKIPRDYTCTVGADITHNSCTVSLFKTNRKYKKKLRTAMYAVSSTKAIRKRYSCCISSLFNFFPFYYLSVISFTQSYDFPFQVNHTEDDFSVALKPKRDQTFTHTI